jgi:hypothetical protein
MCIARSLANSSEPQIYKDTDLDSVQVERETPLRLQALEAPDRDILADLLDQALTPIFDFGCDQGGPILRRALRNHFSQRPGKRHEILVLRHEVGLAVDFH